MADWADTKAEQVKQRWLNELDLDITDLISDEAWALLDALIADALRQAAADARQAENAKCAELVQRRVEPRDA